MVKDLNILKPLYEGSGTSILYTKPALMAWAGPVFMWCCFILALGSVMICMNVVLRKQWMENEKLSYPLVQLPIAMTKDGGTLEFFRNKPFWIGIVAGSSLDLWNGLATLYPNLPLIPVRHDYGPHDLGQFFQSYPWNAMGGLLYRSIRSLSLLAIFCHSISRSRSGSSSSSRRDCWCCPP